MVSKIHSRRSCVVVRVPLTGRLGTVKIIFSALKRSAGEGFLGLAGEISGIVRICPLERE